MRFDRQSAIIGPDGQKKLSESHVAIAGCGGLGCNVATQLAMAGIRKFTLIDFDEISETDLNRQFVHSGKKGPKTESMKQWISGLTECNVVTINERLTENNVLDFIGDSDIAVDCLDDNVSRLTLNGGILKKNIPMVYGGTNGMYGQITTIIPGKTPCLACFLGGNGKDNSSLGATVSAVGSIQAAEVVKYITGCGDILAGKMLTIDISKNLYEVVEIRKNPKCGKCSGI